MKGYAVTCDGCGTVGLAARSRGLPVGWARLRVYWWTGRQGHALDVCRDPMCAARAYEIARDDVRPLRAVRT